MPIVTTLVYCACLLAVLMIGKNAIMLGMAGAALARTSVGNRLFLFHRRLLHLLLLFCLAVLFQQANDSFGALAGIQVELVIMQDLQRFIEPLPDF